MGRELETRNGTNINDEDFDGDGVADDEVDDDDGVPDEDDDDDNDGIPDSIEDHDKRYACRGAVYSLTHDDGGPEAEPDADNNGIPESDEDDDVLNDGFLDGESEGVDCCQRIKLKARGDWTQHPNAFTYLGEYDFRIVTTD